MSDEETALPANLTCRWCDGEAYLCEASHAGTGEMAIHCRTSPWHNDFDPVSSASGVSS